MKDFTSSNHCLSQVHCRTCRASAEWRKSLEAPEICPYGITLENLPASAPPLMQQAGTLAASMAHWALGGFQQADAAEHNRRLAICKACEFWDPSGFIGTGRCQKCGCSTWAKLRMATERCPVGKWETVRATP